MTYINSAQVLKEIKSVENKVFKDKEIEKIIGAPGLASLINPSSAAAGACPCVRTPAAVIASKLASGKSISAASSI